MKKTWKKILNNITPYKPGKPIEEVKRELGLNEVIKLASNENAINPSPKVICAIQAAVKDINRYPDGGCFYLRKALSEKLSVSENNLVFGNGSDEIIVMAINAFVDAGDEVVIADPTFLVYKIASEIKGADVKIVPLNNLKYDIDGMLDAVTERTKIIFIANPDNPTGSYVTDSELAKLIEGVSEDVLIFIDEAYYEFAVGGDYPETLELIKRKDRSIVIARTFSKAYGLAGLRVGYGIAREDIAEVLNKVREPFNVNSIAQAAALAALEDNEYLTESISLVREEKKKFYKLFDSFGLKSYPSRTNFVLVDTGCNSAKVFDQLLSAGIIVREMSAWGIDNCIRVTIGLPEENEKFFKAFKEVMGSVAK